MSHGLKQQHLTHEAPRNGPCSGHPIDWMPISDGLIEFTHL